MAGNVTLLNLAVDCCAAAAPLLLGGGRAAINLYLLHAGPTSANPPHGTDSRQTDGHPTATQILFCILRRVSKMGEKAWITECGGVNDLHEVLHDGDVVVRHHLTLTWASDDEHWTSTATG